jgi:hypothetical protein
VRRRRLVPARRQHRCGAHEYRGERCTRAASTGAPRD